MSTVPAGPPSEDAIRAEIERLSPWFHRIELGPGLAKCHAAGLSPPLP